MEVKVQLKSEYEYSGVKLEPTGEYRTPKDGEYFLDNEISTGPLIAQSDFAEEQYFILKPKRWRAGYGNKYWFVDSTLSVSQLIDTYVLGDDMRYRTGNYFKSKDLAEAALNKVKAAILGVHNEN